MTAMRPRGPDSSTVKFPDASSSARSAYVHDHGWIPQVVVRFISRRYVRDANGSPRTSSRRAFSTISNATAGRSKALLFRYRVARSDDT